MKPKLIYLNIIFTVTLIILLVLSVIFIKKMGELSKADERVEHTYKVLNQADLVKNNLTEAESGTRGFLLTGDSSFFYLYYNSMARLVPSIDTLKKMTSDNEEQQKSVFKLQNWIRIRLSYLNESVNAKNDSTLLKMRLLLGKSAMDSCLAVFTAVKDQELYLLKDRNKSKVFYLKEAPQTFKIIFIFTLIIFIISFLFIAQELRRRAAYQKDLERKLLELNRLNSDLQEFSFIASHNLQEPLRKIRVFGDMLSVKYKDQLNDEAKQIVTRMGAASGTMQELITDFISFINLHSTKEEISLIKFNAIIEKASAEIKSNMPEQVFDLHLSALGNIYGYADQLFLLFRCLLDNAIKFSRQGVPLEISIYGEIIGWKDLPKTRRDMLKCPYYKIIFTDNGMGFDNLFSKKIFKLFQRLDNSEKAVSAKGTGLAIVEHVMTNHHGCVTASGVVGKGAIFNLYFPMEK